MTEALTMLGEELMRGDRLSLLFTGFKKVLDRCEILDLLDHVVPGDIMWRFEGWHYRRWAVSRQLPGIFTGK
jgi:hypothetical protein